MTGISKNCTSQSGKFVSLVIKEMPCKLWPSGWIQKMVSWAILECLIDCILRVDKVTPGSKYRMGEMGQNPDQ